MRFKSLPLRAFNKDNSMNQLKINDTILMQIAIQQEIQRSDQSRYDHKLHGVLMVSHGYDSY